MTVNRPNLPGFDMPADLQPAYTNTVRISHTAAELVLDFARQLPGQTSAEVVSRLLMSPVGAKLLLHALADNLARYEAAYGEIPLPKDNSLAAELFRPPSHPGQNPGEH
jgi:hypothetical protein